MKLFIKYVAIYFIIPTILFGIFSELLLRHVPNRYAYKKDYLDKNSGSIEVLILGESHSYNDINPDYLKFNSFNAANPTQTLNFDFEILKKYGPLLTNLKCIILPIAYPSLVARLENTVESRSVCNYIIYYDLNVPHKITDDYLILNNNFRFNLNRIVGYYLLNINDADYSGLGWGTEYKYSNKQDLNKTGKSRANIETLKDVRIDSNLSVLKSMIDYAKARNIKVLLFTPPAFHTYVENLDSIQLNQAIDAALDLEKHFLNVKYVNLLTDSSFTERDFCDADHLDEFGAQKLTVKIDSIITGLIK